jgi:hypothetical protein
MRQALLALDERDVRQPDDWGRIAENAVVASAVGTNPDARQIGFWRKQEECDVVILQSEGVELGSFIEVKRSGERAIRGIDRAAVALGYGGPTSKARHRGLGVILCRDNPEQSFPVTEESLMNVIKQPVAQWLYLQRDNAGGTLRIRV